MRILKTAVTSKVSSKHVSAVSDRVVEQGTVTCVLPIDRRSVNSLVEHGEVGTVIGVRSALLQSHEDSLFPHKYSC